MMSRNERRVLKKLGKNIKFSRKYLGYSQEVLAEKIGVSRNYIGMIERAEINVPILTLYNIAKALDVSLNSFL